MKRTNNIVEEQFLKDTNRSVGARNIPEDKNPLAFVTEIGSHEIRLINLEVNRFFGLGREETIEKGLDFFKRFVHPDDFKEFFFHFQSLEKLLDDGGEAEVIVRVKNKSQSWKKLLFQYRRYSGFKDKDGTFAFCTAREIKVPSRIHRNHVPRPKLEDSYVKTQNKYSQLLESIEEGFCVIDVLFDQSSNAVDYLFLETNTAFNKHVKRTCGDMTMREMVPDHEDYWFQIYGEVAQSRKPVRFQNYAKHLAQTWFDIYAYPIGGKDSNQVAVLSFDITRRKVTEEKFMKAIEALEDKVSQRTRELETNSKLLQTVFDTTREGVMILKPFYDDIGHLQDFRYLRVNKVISRMYGEKEIEGNFFLEINPGAKTHKIFEAFVRTMTTGNPEDFECRSDKNNSDTWYRITTRRDDKVLIATLEDITKNKFSSRRLKENIRFKKQLIKTSPDVIVIFNLQENNVQFINRNLSSNKGMRRKDIAGMPIPRLIPMIHPHDRGKVIDFHKRISKAVDSDILEVEFRLVTGENQWEWFNARAKIFLRSKKGKVCEYILLLRNIEEQKTTQQALLHAEKLSIKGEVARTLAHELRNPMASIGMAADILAQKTASEKDGELSRYIEVIKRSTTILNRLVTDLLSSSNYSPLSPVKCCLGETLEKALKAAGDRIYLVGIKVIKNYSGRYDILADPEKLKIALLNIIVNASEAMNPNEGVLYLEISRNKNSFQLTIGDNGCGMAKEQLDKLFDAFYTQKPQGVGIGLSSVKNIIEEHDAQVRVESQPNIGTNFLLTFHKYQSFERT